jgi:hypothetical protein
MTLAVALILMVTGLGPQENRMIPPARTAATTAAEVQLAALPRPTTWLECEVSTGRPGAGTATVRTPGTDRDALERAAGAIQAPMIREQKHTMSSDARRGIPQG